MTHIMSPILTTLRSYRK